MTAAAERGVPAGFACRFCRSASGDLVLDAGLQPPAEHFPPADHPGPDPLHPLRMWLCAECHLAQLVEDPAVPEEHLGREPQALVAQGEDAVARLAAAGLVGPATSVAEYGSPHGGSWLGLLTRAGATVADAGRTADVVVDNIGMMHEADQADALAARVARLRPGGTLLIQFQSLASILRRAEWNALRHGHYAYYSTPALAGMLESVGLGVSTAFWFPLYGGTVLLAAKRGGRPDAAARAIEADERSAGVVDPAAVRGLQTACDAAASSLATFLARRREAGEVVLGYSAASRSVALLHRAGVGPDLLPAVADGSPAKQGRRIPGSGIPVISPAELVEARPDAVVLFLDDLLPEVRAALPQIEDRGGRWVPVGGLA